MEEEQKIILVRDNYMGNTLILQMGAMEATNFVASVAEPGKYQVVITDIIKADKRFATSLFMKNIAR